MKRIHAPALLLAKRMAAWTFALTVAVTPALAGPAPAGKPAVRMQMVDGTTRMMRSRADAMRECNTMAARFGQVTWGVTQSHQLRGCMSGRRSME